MGNNLVVLTFADELEELKASARTLNDVVDWFTDRPKLIYQGATFPDEYKIEVDIEYVPSATMQEVALKGAVSFQVICEIRTKVAPNPALADMVKDMSAKNALVFKHSMDLSLNLMTWPMVTILMVVEHIKEMGSYTRTSEFYEFQWHLNRALAHHFGGVTLDSLSQMYNAGLVDLTNDLDTDMKNIGSLLLASSKNSADVVVPHDLSC